MYAYDHLVVFPQSTGFPLYRHQPLCRAACQTFNRRQPSISDYTHADMECTPHDVINFVVVSAATEYFLPRDAMHKRGLCCHAVSVRLSVCHVRELRENE